MKKKVLKKLWKILWKAGLIGLIIYGIIFLVFYFDLDGKLMYHVVEPFMIKRFDNMAKKNPLESPYEQVPNGQESL